MRKFWLARVVAVPRGVTDAEGQRECLAKGADTEKAVSKRGVRDPSPTSLLHAHEEVAADQLNARPESAARADRTDGFPLGDYGRRATEAPGHRDGSSRS